MKKLLILIFSLIILLQTQIAFGEISGHVTRSDENVVIIHHSANGYPLQVSQKLYYEYAYQIPIELGYSIEGELINLSNQTLDRILLRARYYDGDKFRDEMSWIPLKPILRPHESSFFSIPVPDPFLSCYEIWVESYKKGGTEKVREVLDIVDFDIDDGPDFRIQVKNNHDKSLDVWAILTGYDQNNQLKFGMFSEGPERIPSGSTQQLKFFTDSQYSEIINLELLEFLKTNNYEIFAISLEPDRSSVIVGTKYDKWFQIKNQFISKYYSGKINPAHLDNVTFEKNKVSSCASELKGSILPVWIKNNAKWWSSNQISDSDFISGIEYMIKTKVILLPDSELHIAVTPSDKIPDWLKKNAEWWADGIISESEFIKSIQYLISSGIIKI